MNKHILLIDVENPVVHMSKTDEFNILQSKNLH